MKTSRWLPAALALALVPGLALAQDRTADPTKSTDSAASPGSSSMPRMDKDEMKKGGDTDEMKKGGDKDEMKKDGTTAAKDADDKGGDAKGSKYTLWKLHQANQMEIQMSQLALTNATSKPVKSFAQKMITDHKGADVKVTALAKKIGADLDQKPSASDKAEMDEEMSKMDQMKSVKGGAFDAQFVKQMSDDHKKVIDMVATASKDPSQKDIKPLLTQLLPKLRQHEAMAMRLENGHGGMAASSTKKAMDDDSTKAMDSTKRTMDSTKKTMDDDSTKAMDSTKKTMDESTKGMEPAKDPATK